MKRNIALIGAAVLAAGAATMGFAGSASAAGPYTPGAACQIQLQIFPNFPITLVAGTVDSSGQRCDPLDISQVPGGGEVAILFPCSEAIVVCPPES